MENEDIHKYVKKIVESHDDAEVQYWINVRVGHRYFACHRLSMSLTTF